MMNVDKLRRKLLKEVSRYCTKKNKVWIPDYWMATLNLIPSEQRTKFLADMQIDGCLIPHPHAVGYWRLPATQP